MINISVDFKGAKGFDNLIRYVENNALYGELQIAAQILAHHAADKMIDTIIELKKRPDKGTHKLENAITAERISTTGGIEYGVGRIAKLKIEAPYWEVLNNGGYVPPANLGGFGDTLFPPEAGASGEEWVHTGNKSDWFMKPSKAIEGIDYVGKSIRNLDKELKEVLLKMGVEFLKNLERVSK